MRSFNGQAPPQRVQPPAFNQAVADLELRASANGGITELTGAVLAGPGAGSQPASLALSPILTPYVFVEGAPLASEDFWVMMTDPGTFPAGFTGSYGLALVAATAAVVLTVKKIHLGVTTNIGTATWAIAGTVPTLATTGGLAQSFVAGDLIGYVFPASPDATLADIALSLRAQRT